MTCVECGAEIGRAGRCRRCKAPVTRWSGDEVPGTNPAGQQARRSRTAWVARVLVGAVNLLAVWLAAAFVGVYLTQGSPAEAGNDYMPLWACVAGAAGFASVPAITIAVWVGGRRLRERRAATEAICAGFPECARGYSREAVRSYLERSADLRDLGFAPAPPEFSRNWRARGYDPQAVDRHLAELASAAAATGLRVLPAPTSTKTAHHASSPEMRRLERREQESDAEAEWRRVSDLPGARLQLTRSRLGAYGGSGTASARFY
jgi:hypothetical protein